MGFIIRRFIVNTKSINRTVANLAISILLATNVTIMSWGQSNLARNTESIETEGSGRFAQLKKTRVMILGTPHLSGLNNCFVRDSVSPVIDSLRDFAPDVIAIEKVPSVVLEEMAQNGEFFVEIIKSFDGKRFQNGIMLQRLLHISRKGAERRAAQLIRRVEKLDRNERTKLIKFLIASYEYETAVLQWSYFGADKTLPRGALPKSIVQDLDRHLNSANEIFSIGVELAKIQGHSRLFYIDDHYDEALLNEFSSRLVAELTNNSEYLEVANSPFYADSHKELEAACLDGEKMLEHYRRINSSEFGKKDSDLQWGVWLRTGLQSGLDLRRLALWDMRNLRIAANIRELSARNPGKNILVIIGVGHRPFLEGYLSQSLDIEIVRFTR